ncbi:MAG: triose-phosphate isomerase [Oscillospiraceae bacterium]|nr:triose-phosphate isomerase [Oscillospiraceae bacterium]MCL2277804.1 triose-phosphate isomerase [Oscillospiraceae bacterium]
MSEGKNKNLIVAGNWKMYMTGTEAKEYFNALRPECRDGIEIMLFVPATALPLISATAKKKNIVVGLQNMHWEKDGAYTGEISAEMLLDAGGTHVIIGHSKRRSMFHETDIQVNLKVRAAQRNGITPLVCIGETLQERESGEYHKVLCRQIIGGLIGAKISPLIIAYEPIWAIGTGKIAGPEQISETMGWIRRVLIEQFGEQGSKVPLLYGGSVKPDNIAGVAALDGVDGFLIGGASLAPESMNEILGSI